MIRASLARVLAVFGLLLGAIVLTGIHSDNSNSLPSGKPAALRAYANLPVYFIENAGQTDPRVRFYAQGSGYVFYLSAQEAVFQFAARSSTSAAQFDASRGTEVRRPEQSFVCDSLTAIRT